MEILTDAEIVHYFGHSKRKRGARDAHLYRWNRGPLRYLEKHHAPFWSLLLRLMKAPERLGRLRSPPPGPVPPEPPEPEPLELRWSPGEPPYLVEISNSPRFLDSFLAVTREPGLTFPAELVSRLAPGTYHWRTRPLDRPWDGTDRGCGSFVRR